MMESLSKIMSRRMETIMADHNNLKDYKNRVHALRLRQSSFIPEGEKEERSYYQLVVDVEIDGEDAELVFKCSADKALLLKAAASIPDNFLDADRDRR